MNQSDSPVIVQYRISPSLVNLVRVADLSDALMSIFSGSTSSCTLNCDERQYNGSPAQFRQLIPSLDQRTLHHFTLNITVPVSPQAQGIPQIQHDMEQIQKQIQQAQAQAQAQPAQRAQFRQQIAELQSKLQPLQKQLAQQPPAQFQFTLSLNWISENVSLSIVGQTVTAARQYIAASIDEAVHTIRRLIATSDAPSDAVEQGGRLLGEISAIAEKLPHVSQIAEQATSLLPSIREAITAVSATEAEVARLRRSAESERDKVNSLRDDVTQAKTELLQMLASARASHAETLAGQKQSYAEMLASQKGSHAEMLAAQKGGHAEVLTSQRQSHAEMLASKKQSYELAEKRLSDLQNRATELVNTLATDESSTSKLATKAKELVEGLEQQTKDTATQTENSLAEWNTKFEALLDECAKKREQIHQLLGAAVAANLSTTFKERQIALEKGRTAWLVCIFAITTAIVGVSYWIIDSTLSNNTSSAALAWVLRAFTVLPLVLLDLFCISQYKRKMLLADQYAFKASIAASFDYYRDEIRLGFREGDKMAEFISQAVGRLWAEPYHATELSPAQIKRLTRMLEKLGITALKEGSAVTQAALHSRGITPAQATANPELSSTRGAGEEARQRN